VLKASERKVLAHKAVSTSKMSIALACRTFMVSEACYRYTLKLSDENEKIAALLVNTKRLCRILITKGNYRSLFYMFVSVLIFEY